MGDDSLQNHPNWNGILQWSLRFQDTPSENRNLEPLDQERREFLLGAFEDYAAMTVDPVKSMRGHLEVLKNPTSSNEDCAAALEELAFHAEDMDQANDLYLIGGLQVCCAYIKHNNPELQSLSCEVIGSAVQNNEKITQFATETFVLADLLKMVEESSHQIVKVKSLYAVSCLVRGNEGALAKLNELEGYNVLIRALQSSVKKLRTKSLFLISNVCVDSPSQCQIYCSMGITHQLFALCEEFARDDVISAHDVALQHTLKLLLTLSKHCDVQFPADAASSLTNLKGRLEKEGQQEEVELCSLLLKWCPSLPNNIDR